jgi:predicted membrane channel-forming protein YqfA (hemolysin III family)
MTTYEFWMLISSYAASVIGGICFALRIPDTSPEIWGYFEWYHLSVGIASIIVYCINYSLSLRSIMYD